MGHTLHAALSELFRGQLEPRLVVGSERRQLVPMVPLLISDVIGSSGVWAGWHNANQPTLLRLVVGHLQ